MPIYEYKCAKCAKVQEKNRKYEDRKTTMSCPICGGVCEYTPSAPGIVYEMIDAETRRAYEKLEDM